MTKRPNILLLTTQLGYGGAETSFIRLANALQESMDVTVALFASDYSGSDYAQGHEPLRASVILLDTHLPREAKLLRWWQRIIALRKLKSVHDVTISFLSGPNLVNVLAGYSSRTVVSLRGSRAYDTNAPRRQRLLFQYFFDPLIYLLAARIVPVSAGFTNEIRAVAGRTVLSKIRVIPPFVDAALLQQRREEEAPSPYATLKGQKVIVGVGRLSVEKGFQHLIRVFAGVAKNCAGAKLLLVGDGPMREQLRQSCERYGLAVDNLAPGIASVIFAGYQPKVLPFIALARVYVMCSSSEGFSNTIVEALAAGVPVIAADVPWGVRPILEPQMPELGVPYPTLKPTRTEYGMLMPRIDTLQYEEMWVTMLQASVQSHVAPGAKIFARVEELDSSHIVPLWRRLIEEVMHDA